MNKNQRYYQKHKDEIKRKNLEKDMTEYRRKYYLENKERLKALHKKYYEEHKEDILKKKKETDKLTNYSANKRYYQRHKEELKAKRIAKMKER